MSEIEEIKMFGSQKMSDSVHQIAMNREELVALVAKEVRKHTSKQISNPRVLGFFAKMKDEVLTTLKKIIKLTGKITDPEERVQKYKECIRSILQWSDDIKRTEMARLEKTYPCLDDEYSYAMVHYAKSAFVEEGSSARLQMKPLSSFVFSFYSAVMKNPTIKDGSFTRLEFYEVESLLLQIFCSTVFSNLRMLVERKSGKHSSQDKSILLSCDQTYKEGVSAVFPEDSVSQVSSKESKRRSSRKERNRPGLEVDKSTTVSSSTFSKNYDDSTVTSTEPTKHKRSNKSPRRFYERSHSHSKNSEARTYEDQSSVSSSDDKSRVRSSDERSRVLSSDERSHVRASDDKSRVRGSDERSRVRGSDERSHVRSSDERSHVRGSDDKSHVRASDERSHVRASDERSHVRASDEKSHVRASDERSHVRASDDRSHVRGSDERSHVRGSDERSHVRGSGSDDRSHVRGSDERSHVRGSDEMSHVRGSDERSHVRGSDEMSHVRGSDERSHVRGSDERSHVRGSDEMFQSRNRETSLKPKRYAKSEIASSSSNKKLGLVSTLTSSLTKKSKGDLAPDDVSVAKPVSEPVSEPVAEPVAEKPSTGKSVVGELVVNMTPNPETSIVPGVNVSENVAV
jgi:hypothetical protein